MDTPRPEQARQAAVFHIYLELQAIASERFSGCLAGRLVLSVAPGLQGAEVVVAALIAGGAVLAVDRDSERLKASVRDGSCDFMVNTLDEAIRILKNEIRKGTPVSACLQGDPFHILPSMTELGLQPDLIAGAPDCAESGIEDSGKDVCRSAIAQMIQWGAMAYMPSALLSAGDAATDDILWTAETPHDLRQMDSIALGLLPANDRIRRLWLERASGYFYHQHPPERDFAMRAKERTRLVEAFRAARSSGALQSEVSVCWQEPGAGRRTLTL